MNMHVSTAVDQGVGSHSSIVGQTEYVIFCVGQSLVRQQALKSVLGAQGIGFKSLKGSYKGVSENSFIVNRENFDTHILPMGWCDDEESYLVLSGYKTRDARGATLHYVGDVNGVLNICEEYLGLFTAVDKKTALKQDSWTFDPTVNQYYVCVPQHH